MRLTDSFWKHYELDLQEVKIAYLNWAIDYAKEPGSEHRHLFLWDHQKSFCLVDSRYGRAFAISPFGVGVRRVPSPKVGGVPRGLDEMDMALRARLSKSTNKIRFAIREALLDGNVDEARNSTLNFHWLKLGPHELLFDRIQYGEDSDGRIKKGRWGLDESEKWHTLKGIRNRVINVIRFGEHLQDGYVLCLNKKLPGFGRNSRSTFISSALTWNKFGLCAFDCGPVLWSRKGFVHFNQVKDRMNQIGWPYHSSARKVLKPLYHIALNYRKPPIRLKNKPDEGYSRMSMHRRRCQLYEVIDNILNEIDRIRRSISG